MTDKETCDRCNGNGKVLTPVKIIKGVNTFIKLRAREMISYCPDCHICDESCKNEEFDMHNREFFG